MKIHSSFLTFRLFLCLAVLTWAIPTWAQQDDFDPIVPPDPDASYIISVASEPADAAVLTGSGAFNAGAVAHISCTPSEGYVLDHWTLNGSVYNTTDSAFLYTVERKNAAFVAHLRAVYPHTLSVSTNLPNAAVIEGEGSYYPGHTVQVACTPNKDYNFLYWTLNGSIYSYDLSFSYTMGDSNIDFVAIFTHTPHYTVSAQPDDAQAGRVTIVDGSYLSGEVLNMQAYANSEYLFSHWTLNGTYFTDEPAFSYTVGNMDAKFVAVFDFNPQKPDDPAVVLTSTVYVKAEPMGAATFNIRSGTEYHEGDTIIIRAMVAEDYIFDGWYADGQKVASATAFTYIIGEKDITFTLRATPIVYSQLNLVASPAGAVSFNIRSGNIYRENTTLSLRASVVAGYVFSGWYIGDSLLSETADLQYTIGTTAATLTARATIIEPDPDEDWDPLPPFDPEMESVYIIAQSANSATGKAYGSASYVVGKEATLRAVPAHGYVFARWDDGNTDSVRTVIATTDITYTAYFTPLTYQVSVLSDDGTMGSVAGSGTYAYRSAATITASPATGYTFVRWSDDNIDPVHTVYITSDTTFIAYFEPIRYTITVQTSDPALGVVSGGGIYAMNDSATLTATPLDFNQFLQWDDGNTDNPRTIRVTSNRTYVALFLEDIEPEHPEEEGRLTGKFQVSPYNYVVFAQGNLQYNAGNGEKHRCADGTRGQGTWRLAEQQYDCIGLDNANAAADYNGWIDIFGWGTGGWQSEAVAYQPWHTSAAATDYQPGGAEDDLTGFYEYADWGIYNAIYNGGNRVSAWRVPTAAEWEYLFQHGKWTMARIKTSDKKSTRGFMLIPNDFKAPAGIPLTLLGTGKENNTLKTISQGDYASNLYTIEQFEQLQKAGVVFLPCAGFRDAGEVDYVNMVGGYWSSTAAGTDYARALYFFSTMVDASYLPLRSFGYSVRLVHDVAAPIATDVTSTDTQDRNCGRITKVLHNGQVLIIRSDKVYNIVGDLITTR